MKKPAIIVRKQPNILRETYYQGSFIQFKRSQKMPSIHILRSQGPVVRAFAKLRQVLNRLQYIFNSLSFIVI